MSDDKQIAVQEALAKSNDNLAEAIRALTVRLEATQGPANFDHVPAMMETMMGQITSTLMVQLEAKFPPDHEVEGEVLVKPSDVRGVRLCP